MDRDQVNEFLAKMEQRAYRRAQLATRNHADACDIVQDAMIKWVSYYAEKELDAWRPLFYRVLETCIMDWHRKNVQRNRWFFWKQKDASDEDSGDLVEEAPDHLSDPARALSNDRTQTAMLAGVEALPIRQQQCFLLRCWEGMSVEETAQILEISSGSVKTHTHRALKKLEEIVKAHETD